MVSTELIGEKTNDRDDDICKGSKYAQEIKNLPCFHVANIQNLITKSVCGEKGFFVAQKEKMNFLREQCKEERPYFLAFAETYLKESIKEAEFEIEGYSNAFSHRRKRIGGGVIIYVRNDLTYQILISTSDEMCSMVSIYINELNLFVFMVYRPPPNHKNQYHGEILESSFKNIIIYNIKKVILLHLTLY